MTAIEELSTKASQAADMLKALSNEQRLLILCYLVSAGELSVSALGKRMELSQSALSQHLARLREQEIVTTRREAQTLFYRVCDSGATQILELLRDIYCSDLVEPSADTN